MSKVHQMSKVHRTFSDQDTEYIEKRRLFIQSYNFTRKKNTKEKVRFFAVKVKKLVWVRLHIARSLPLMLWKRLRRAWSRYIHKGRSSFYCNNKHLIRPYRVYRPIICSGDGSC